MQSSRIINQFSQYASSVKLNSDVTHQEQLQIGRLPSETENARPRPKPQD